MIDKPSPQEIQAERDQAMQEYQAELDAVKARTAKLRAERMEREARGEFIKPVKAPKPIAAKPVNGAAKPARTKAKAPVKKTATKKSLKAKIAAE